MNAPVLLPSRRWWIRSSRFWAIVSGALAGICIAVLFIWSASDASFRPALLQWEYTLGLEKLLIDGPRFDFDWNLIDRTRSIHWDGLGKRIVALHVIISVGLGATALLTLLALWPPKLRLLLVAVVLISAWGVLCATQKTMDDWRTRRQVAAIFPQIEQAGLALHNEWPVRSGEVSPGIVFYVSPEKYPDVLSVRGRRNSSPFREAIGHMITRGRQGIIRFDLAPSYDSTVEYHPEGTLPSAHQSGFGNPSPPVAAYHRLKDNWYLVRYGG